MHAFGMTGRGGFAIGCALLLAAVTAMAAVADEPPPFTPLSPASASKPGPFIHADGATLYRSVCQGCHMPDARGAQGAGVYPPLAGNAKLASAAFPLARVLGGWRAMPRFAEMMSDEQIAAVLNYVRTNFGNQYPDRLRTDDVRRMREAMKGSGK
jgi:mono/diheme cytochrome c family protein